MAKKSQKAKGLAKTKKKDPEEALASKSGTSKTNKSKKRDKDLKNTQVSKARTTARGKNGRKTEGSKSPSKKVKQSKEGKPVQTGVAHTKRAEPTNPKKHSKLSTSKMVGKSKKHIKSMKMPVTLLNSPKLGEPKSFSLKYSLFHVEPEEVAEIDNKYKSIILKYFEKGYRIDSDIEVQRFKMFWEKEYGQELNTSDDGIRRKIRELTFQYENKAYWPECILKEDNYTKIKQFIEDVFSDGAEFVYFDVIMKECSKEFEGGRITNPDILREYLSYKDRNGYFFNKRYISKRKNITISIEEEIAEVMKTAGRPISQDEIAERLPHLPKSKIISNLRRVKEFIWNSEGEYFHVDIIEIEDKELEEIYDIINAEAEEHGFITGEKVIDKIKIKNPHLLRRLEFCSIYGLRNAIAYKLGDKITLNGKVFTVSGNDSSVKDIIAEFCREHDKFTLSDLKQFRTQANLPEAGYFGTVCKNSLRISDTEFVSIGSVDFKTEYTDSVLEKLCLGEYIPFYNIHYNLFPDIGIHWNDFLLESFVLHSSKKFKLLNNRFLGQYCTGAIVKRTSLFDEFDDILLDVLIREKINLNKNDVAEYFVTHRYLAVKRYKNIDGLIERARKIRGAK